MTCAKLIFEACEVGATVMKERFAALLLISFGLYYIKSQKSFLNENKCM